jgi:hypothetical protein
MENVINILNNITYRSYVILSPREDTNDAPGSDLSSVPYYDKFSAIYNALNVAKRYMDNIPEKRLMLLRKNTVPIS